MIIKNKNLLVNIKFTSNSLQEDILKDSFIFEYIPDFEIILDNYIIPTYIITIESGNKPQIIINESRNESKILYNDNCSHKDIVTLIDYALEYFRQLNGVYCVHGTLVGLNGKGLLLCGQLSGLGKTSLGIELCKNWEFKFYGDEKILVSIRDGDIIASSTKKLKYNKSYLEEYHQIKETDFIDKYSASGELELKMMVQPQICPNGIFHFEKWNELKIDFHLYEEITRKIRGCSRRVSNFLIPIDSIDTSETSLHRSEFCKLFARNIPSYHMVGDVQFVADEISKKIDVL